jgi:hypothetical protein
LVRSWGEVNFFLPVSETSRISREESVNTMKLPIATFFTIRRRLYISAAVIGLMSISLAHGQEKPARLTFDVAAIRPSQPGVRGGLIKPLP